MLTPRGRLEYSRDFASSSATSLGYADIGTLPYLLDGDGRASVTVSLELGIYARFGDNATLGLDYGTSFGTSECDQSHKFAARLGVQF